jgi:mannose-6-phosphate isomerase-like protein (cupin superfamily)
MNSRIRLIAIAGAAFSSLAVAQSTIPDHLRQAQLLDKVGELKRQARAGDGSASVKIADYPNHYTMISYRAKSGGGEVHERFADIFYVLSGTATLITGGTLVDPIIVSPGELRGSAVTGKSEIVLHPGDIVHIPAHTPHQLLISGGQEFAYFVVKVKEQ